MVADGAGEERAESGEFAPNEHITRVGESRSTSDDHDEKSSGDGRRPYTCRGHETTIQFRRRGEQ